MKNTRWTSADLLNLKATQAAKPKKAKAKTAGLTGIEAIEARRKAVYLVGVDPGVNTGFAVKYKGEFSTIATFEIFDAIMTVWDFAKSGQPIFVRIEDARQRTWFGKTDRERLKGAGSVERDCKIWEEVLTELQIPFEFVHPKNVKATTAEYFEKLTGWGGRTSIHAREAAWLII